MYCGSTVVSCTARLLKNRCSARPTSTTSSYWPTASRLDVPPSGVIAMLKLEVRCRWPPSRDAAPMADTFVAGHEAAVHPAAGVEGLPASTRGPQKISTGLPPGSASFSRPRT